MTITSICELSKTEVIYTVELEPDVYVDVKRVGNLYYIMSCEDGYNFYNSDGNTFDYYCDESAILKMVQST